MEIKQESTNLPWDTNLCINKNLILSSIAITWVPRCFLKLFILIHAPTESAILTVPSLTLTIKQEWAVSIAAYEWWRRPVHKIQEPPIRMAKRRRRVHSSLSVRLLPIPKVLKKSRLPSAGSRKTRYCPFWFASVPPGKMYGITLVCTNSQRPIKLSLRIDFIDLSWLRLRVQNLRNLHAKRVVFGKTPFEDCEINLAMSEPLPYTHPIYSWFGSCSMVCEALAKTSVLDSLRYS